MNRYKIVTLVDITKSNANRAETDKIKVGQQANFNSLIQTIGIRANVQWLSEPMMHTGILPEDLDGKANHWVWEFIVEQNEIFLKNSDPVGLLVDDLNGVPIISNLKDSVDLDPPAFITKGPKANTWVFQI